MRAKTIALLVALGLFLILLFQNTDVVTLRIFMWKISMSQVILTPLLLFIGFIGGFILGKFHKKAKPLDGNSDNISSL